MANNQLGMEGFPQPESKVDFKDIPADPATGLSPHWDTMTEKEREGWCWKQRVHYPYEDKGPITPELLYWLGGLLESHPFVFAKSMPKNPHWYTHRKKWSDVGDDVFTEVNKVIREYGSTEWFWKAPWRKLNVNGFRYWNYYSSHLQGIDILNRVPVQQVSSWDDVAGIYDSTIDHDLTKQVFDIIGNTSELNVLDIGCGTGRFLDETGQHPSRYTGVDPSPQMLNALLDKHAEHAGCLVNMPFEEWLPELPEYDLIVSLFEAGSQIPINFLEYLPKLTAAGGRWVVMIDEDAHPIMELELPGTVTRVGEYVLIDGRNP